MMKWAFERSLKKKILYCPTMVGKPLQNSSKIFSMDFTIHWWYLCEFPEDKKSNKSQVGNRKLQKE